MEKLDYRKKFSVGVSDSDRGLGLGAEFAKDKFRVTKWEISGKSVKTFVPIRHKGPAARAEVPCDVFSQVAFQTSGPL
jgi:hypothetical protein